MAFSYSTFPQCNKGSQIKVCLASNTYTNHKMNKRKRHKNTEGWLFAQQFWPDLAYKERDYLLFDEQVAITPDV